jgi:hypothetical protein
MKGPIGVDAFPLNKLEGKLVCFEKKEFSLSFLCVFFRSEELFLCLF